MCGGLASETQNPVGGIPPYSFIKKSGFLPPGMTLELNGLISGSPTVPGTYNFKLCAKDLYMNEGCQDYTFVVAKEDEASYASPSTPSAPTPAPQPAEKPASEYEHTITSATCTAVPSKNEYDPYLNKIIRANGTMRGSVGATFYTSSSYEMLTCGAWTLFKTSGGTSQFCNRKAGEPEQSTWTFESTDSGSMQKTFSFFATSGCCYDGTRLLQDNKSKQTKILDQPCS